MAIRDLLHKIKTQYYEVKQKDEVKFIQKIPESKKDKKQKNKLINMIVFYLVITMLCSIMMYYLVMHTHALQDDFAKEQNSMEGTFITYVKNNIDANASSKLKDISHNIVDEIYNTMDTEQLQQELSDGIVSPELEKLFRSQILDICTIPGLDSQQNNIFICNSEGILADYSEIYASPANVKRTWEYEISQQANKELFKHTIEQMLNQDSTEFLVEERKNINSNHAILSSMNQETLFELYSKEGLDSIKNYTFLVPVYVMKNNDIFGIADIVDGQRIDNNKFIIVQRYSLYDYIKLYHLDAQVNTEIHYKFEHSIFVFYMFIIVYVTLSLLNIIYVISIFNKEMVEDYDYDNCNEFKERRSHGRRATDKYIEQILELVEQERQKKATDTEDTLEKKNE